MSGHFFYTSPHDRERVSVCIHIKGRHTINFIKGVIVEEDELILAREESRIANAAAFASKSPIWGGYGI